MARARSFLILAFLIYHSAQATGGSSAGNGGGGWVCRNQDGSIRSIELADIIEAKSELLVMQDYDGDYMQIVSSVEQKLTGASIDRFRASGNNNLFSWYVNNLHGLRPSANVRFTGQRLTIINDALYYATPTTATCNGGSTHYEQIVNYGDDNNILVQSNLFGALTPQSKAALVIHEAVYAFFRENKKDTDSLRSRIITGLGFTTETSDEIRSILSLMNAVGGSFLFTGENNVAVRKANPDGSLESISRARVSLSANFFSCSDGSSSFAYVSGAQTDADGIATIDFPTRYNTCNNMASIYLKINGVTYERDLPMQGWATKLKTQDSAAVLSCEVFSSRWARKFFITCADIIKR